MPNIYVADNTKELLELVANKDKRTQDGEINYLLSQRATQIGMMPVTTPESFQGSSNT